MTELSLRSVQDDDVPFVRAMLCEAAFWREGGTKPDPDAALREPHLAVYVDGWGRSGDRGLIAFVDGMAAGAVWIRSFTDDSHGYGFVDPSTPELSIAVAPAYRGRGIGRALLAAMLAQSRLDGVERISLSVETDNAAIRLYEQSGFRVVDTVGNAVTMVRNVAEPTRR